MSLHVREQIGQTLFITGKSFSPPNNDFETIVCIDFIEGLVLSPFFFYTTF